MVLISHSMGGLLSQMQAVTTRRVLWNSVFQSDADQLYAKVPADNVVKRALIFDANPRVDRIVFICVPHRGSDLAINWIGSFGIGLISLPGKLLSGAGDLVTAPLEKDVGLKHMPTGINGLSPRSPVLRGLDTLPIHAPYHTIVGDRGRGDTPNSSDGVVAYWSSHLTGAQSELIVPGPHGSFALPQTVSELKRILRLNLAAVSAPHRNTMPKSQRSAAGSESKNQANLNYENHHPKAQLLAMNRYLAMPVAQNAAIGMGLLCPSNSISYDAMDVGVVVDRESFVSRSKEENAATATVESAAATKYLPSFVPRQKDQLLGRGNVKRFPVHFRLRHFEIRRQAFCNRMRWVDHPNSLKITVWQLSPGKIAISAH